MRVLLVRVGQSRNLDTGKCLLSCIEAVSAISFHSWSLFVFVGLEC